MDLVISSVWIQLASPLNSKFPPFKNFDNSHLHVKHVVMQDGSTALLWLTPLDKQACWGSGYHSQLLRRAWDMNLRFGGHLQEI